MPPTIPSWWPNSLINSESFLHIGDYTPSNPQNLKNDIDIQMIALNNIMNRPNYSLTAKKEELLLCDYFFEESLFIELSKITDPTEIDSIDISIESAIGSFAATYKPFENSNLFMNDHYDINNMEDEITTVNNFRLLLVSSKDKLARTIKNSLVQSRSIYIPIIDQKKYLAYVREPLQNNIITNNKIDYNNITTIECIIRYWKPFRQPVKMIINN